MVTIKDISKATNFSITTVSRALNNHDDVSEKTKKIIQEAAMQLEYVPNSNAQRLVTRKSNKIAFIVFGFGKASGEDNFVYEMLIGMQEESLKLGYELVFLLGNIVFSKDVNHISEIFKKYDLAGMVVMGISSNTSYYKEIKDIKYPLVCIDGDIISENVSNVSVDNYMAEYEAARLLIDDKRRKRIMFLSGKKHSIACIKRQEGYEQAIKESNLEPLVCFGDYSYDKAYELIGGLLKDNVEIDGILAANDMMAIGAIKAIEENGFIVGKDIDVIGFDDILISSFIKKPLSTIRQDKERVGATAVKVLNKIINNEEFEKINIVPHEINLRETT